MTRTRKPCPACGEVCQFRPAAEVCGGCKGLLKDGDKYRKLAKQAKNKPYGIPQSAHSLPYIKYASRGFGDDVDHQRNFQQALFSLLGDIGGPLPTNAPWNEKPLLVGYSREYSGSATVMLRTSVADLLRDMYEAVQGMTVHAYNEGHSRGSNMMMGLASGEVSVNDFNEATLNRG